MGAGTALPVSEDSSVGVSFARTARGVCVRACGVTFGPREAPRAVFFLFYILFIYFGGDCVVTCG